MSKISTKLFGMLAILLFIAVMPIVVLATNEDISIVNTQNDEGKQEYIIYINGYTDKNFKYAFSNANPGEMDLVYINSITDLGENQIAYLDADTYEKLSNDTIYIWAKAKNDLGEEVLILNGIQLDFQNSLTKENIDLVETITNRIPVKIVDNQNDTETVRQENIDGIEETAAVGYVEITDGAEGTYYYERTKITDSAEHARLMELAEKINAEYDELDMYEKVQLSEEFYTLYSKLIEQANWQEVKNQKVYQPEESVEGDKYVVLLKKVSNNGEETTDVQLLTAFENKANNYEKEQVVTQETTRLPITYDSILLFVILAIVVIALVIVYIRMKKVSKKDEEK